MEPIKIMSTLNDIWNSLIQLPNGEKVGRRMVQLWDFALKPENENLIPSITQVNNIIVQMEEKLLQRTPLDIVRNRAILRKFQQSMRDCSEKEWGEFIKQISIQPLNPEDAKRTLIDSSGLVRNTGFEAWILGETETPLSQETHQLKARLLKR